ncbi:ABC transporter substrate-binding protein/permease [Peptoniphilaceae bacterium SGI.131]
MKKFYVFLLSLLLLLTACSDKTGSQTDNEVKALLGKDKLVVATSADYPPYEFIKNINGKDEFVGLDISIIKYIAQKWDMDLEIQDVKFDALLAGLETGMYDMVIAAMSPSPDRKASFSESYYNAVSGVIIRKEDAKKIKSKEDLEGLSIGVQLGTVQEGIVDGLKNISKKALSNANTLLLELKSKKTDAIIMEKPVAQSYANSNPDLLVVDSIEYEDEAGGSSIAMPEKSLELTEKVNQVIAEMKEKGLIDQWLVEANDLANDSEKKDYNYLFVDGIKNTLILSFLSLLIGFTLALFVTFIRRSKLVIKFIAQAFVEIIRGTPLMLQILIVYYGLDFLGIKMSAFTASLIAVSINSAAYVSEIIRSGIESIDKGQMEAGRSLGLSSAQTMKKIIMPQAIKNILPALGNEFVTLIKETSIASTIGVAELMYQTSKVQSLTYQAMKPLLIVSLIYFVLTFGLSLVLKAFERRLKYDN